MVAQLFLKHIFKLHRIPNSIISDRGPIFTRNFGRSSSLYREFICRFILPSSPIKWLDKGSEQIDQKLPSYVGDKPKDWSQWIALAEWGYNSSQHASMKVTPFEALFGCKPPKLLSYVYGIARVEEVELTLQNQLQKPLKQNMAKAQVRTKK